MAPKTHIGVPTKLVAGDTWKWRVKDLVDFPQSEGWALKYEIVGVGFLHLPDTTKPGSSVTYTTTGDDAGYWVALVTTTDSQLDPGRYRVIGRVEGSGAYATLVYTVSDTVVVIVGDPRLAIEGEYQTHAEQMLALLDAEIKARISGTGSGHEAYTIEGRSITKIPIESLTKLRGKYAALVQQERTGQLGRQVKTVFGRVTD